MNRVVAGLIVTALAAIPQVRAQQSTTVGAFELRPMVGAFVPTGGMRNDFRDGVLVGAQGGFEFTEKVHLILGGFWSPNTTHFRTLSSRDADIWQFDAGAEFNLIKPMGRAWFFRPFAGAGAGIRTYDFKGAGGNTCTAGYAALGAEAQRFEGAFRLEMRDNVTCFESPTTGMRTTRNDIGISFGFVYHVK